MACPARVFGPAALPTGTWTHLALTYNGSTLRLYLDGDQVSASAQSGTLASSSAPLEIGGDGIYGQYFQGLIDEVRVYNVARSQAADSDRHGDACLPAAPPPRYGAAVEAGVVGWRRRLRATGSSCRWDAASDDRGVVGYEVERCKGEGCTDFAHLATRTSTGYSDTSVAAGTSYAYRVRAADAAGNLGPFSDTATATTPAPPDVEPPSKPGRWWRRRLRATGSSCRWDAASDDRGVVGYEVERCKGEGCTDFAHLTRHARGTGYSDTSVAASTSYAYRVRAADAAGNLGPFSDTATATTPAPPDVEPPSKPGSLVATAAASDRVELRWGAASDDRGVVGYEVERCQGGGAPTSRT